MAGDNSVCAQLQLELDLHPDSRHPWRRRSMMAERQDEWRCGECGELAMRGVITGNWEFLSPVRGRDQWGTVSHECVKREWS